VRGVSYGLWATTHDDHVVARREHAIIKSPLFPAATITDFADMFRAWYHACQVGSAAFILAFVGTAIPMLSVLRFVGLCILIPLGVLGALLAIIGVTRGIRSGCPMCGRAATWVRPAQHVLAVDCEKCGLVGGNPLKVLRPRLVRDLHEDDKSGSAITHDD